MLWPPRWLLSCVDTHSDRSVPRPCDFFLSRGRETTKVRAMFSETKQIFRFAQDDRPEAAAYICFVQDSHTLKNFSTSVIVVVMRYGGRLARNVCP